MKLLNFKLINNKNKDNKLLMLPSLSQKSTKIIYILLSKKYYKIL